MLMAALAPAMSRVLPTLSGGRGPVLELCTAAGLKRVALDREQTAGRPGANPDQDDGRRTDLDCPYCSLHLDRVLPQTGPVSHLQRTPESQGPVIQAPRADPGRAWLSARSRAPPASA